MTTSASHSLLVELTDANFAAEVEQASLPVFFDFHTASCGPCKAIAPLLEQLAGLYRGQIKFGKVDADDNPALSERFKIRGVPTFMMFQHGKMVEVAGAQGGGSLTKAWFHNLLDKYAQTPIALKAADSRAFRAFQGDAALRESVVARVRGHIQAGHIVPASFKGPVGDAGNQRFSLMGAALDTGDLQVFESKLGIPAAVGRLQENVHGLFGKQVEEAGKMEWRLPSPHDAKPLQWWQAIPPGADLQSLPSRFFAWLLRERSTEVYPYVLGDNVRSTMESLAQLHERYARGDAPADEEWRQVRRTASELVVESEKRRGMAGAGVVPHGALTFIEMLTLPTHELGDDLMAPMRLAMTATEYAVSSSYTPEAWAARRAKEQELNEAWREALSKKFEGDDHKDPRSMTPEETQELQKKAMEMINSLDEYKAFLAYVGECRRLDAPLREKVELALAERMHAGLMQALNDTIAAKA